MKRSLFLMFYFYNFTRTLQFVCYCLLSVSFSTLIHNTSLPVRFFVEHFNLLWHTCFYILILAYPGYIFFEAVFLLFLESVIS